MNEGREMFVVPGVTTFIKELPSGKAVVLENEGFPTDQKWGKQLMFPKSCTSLSDEGELRVEYWLAKEKGLLDHGG